MHRFDDRKVLLGGLAAGAVLLAGNLVIGRIAGFNLVTLAGLWLPEMKAVELGSYAGAHLLIGIFVAWVRAALIPFYGTGARSAVRAGLAVWLVPMALPMAFRVIQSMLFFGSLEWRTLGALALSAVLYATAGLAAATAARAGALGGRSGEALVETA
ncbi:MAG TPA: hypothetical protein VM778_02455 [Gemmatimonadota bacterium]|nr:hypothetical protein [Gemmatimonadota bacterium]